MREYRDQRLITQLRQSVNYQEQVITRLELQVKSLKAAVELLTEAIRCQERKPEALSDLEMASPSRPGERAPSSHPE